jgi:aspartate kinase
VVCSARSGSTKALGTTNLLLQASREALTPSPNSFSPSAEPTSGSATPFYPKRVGSGYFNEGLNGMTSNPNEASAGLNASISSLRDMKLSRSSSPSPFQPSTSSPSSSGVLPPRTPGFETPSSNLPAFHKTVDQLKKDHLEAARNAVQDPALLRELNEEIERDLDRLRSFLSAAQIIDEISPRSQDSIIGIGERLACKIVAASLRDRVRPQLPCMDQNVRY